MERSQRVLDLINDQKEDYSAAERKVADYVLNNPRVVIELNVTDLAEQSGTSDATVIRFCKRIGYSGFYQMKLSLAEDMGKNQEVGYEDSSQNPETAKSVIECLVRDLLRISDMLDEDRIQECVDLICSSRKIYLYAVGNSIPTAMDFAFRLNRMGIDAVCQTIVEYGLAAMMQANQDDLLISISHSGSSTHVLKAVELANSKQMKTIAVTSSSNNTLARKSDYYLLTTVAAPLFGDNGTATHLYDQALLDSILYFVARRQKKQENSSQVEAALAEYKL